MLHFKRSEYYPDVILVTRDESIGVISIKLNKVFGIYNYTIAHDLWLTKAGSYSEMRMKCNQMFDYLAAFAHECDYRWYKTYNTELRHYGGNYRWIKRHGKWKCVNVKRHI